MKIYLDTRQNEALAKIEKFTQPSSLRWVFVDKEDIHSEDNPFYRKISKLEFHPYADDVTSTPCWILGDLVSFVDNCIKQGYAWRINVGGDLKNCVSYYKDGETKTFHNNDELIDNLYEAIISFLSET